MVTSDSDLESVLSSQYPLLNNSKKDSLKYICNYPNCKESFKRSTNLDRHEFHHTGIKKHECHYDGCTKSYVIITHLKRHIDTFHKKIYKPKIVKCRIETCNKSFDYVCSMERHIKEVHENLKIYTCKICTKDFNRKIQLRRHEIIHTGSYPYNCKICSKGFVQKIHFDSHKCDKIYKCEICQITCPKWSALVEHKKSNHPKTHACGTCSKSFDRKSLLKSHEQLHKDENDREVFKCSAEGCPRFYYHAKNLKQHIKVQHEGKKFECPITGCNLKLSTKCKLNLHIKNIHESGTKPKKLTEKKEQKKIRSDCGKKKISMATKLAGIVVAPEIEKIILSGRADEISIIEDVSDDITSENEELLTAPLKVLLENVEKID